MVGMTRRVARRWQWVVLLLAALPLVVYVAASVAVSDTPAPPRDPILLDVSGSTGSTSPDATASPSGEPTKPDKPSKSPTRSPGKSPQVVLPSPDDLDDDDDDDGRDDDPDDETDDD